MSDLAKDVTLWKHSSAETAKLWVKFQATTVGRQRPGRMGMMIWR